MWILHILAPSTFSVLFETSMSNSCNSYTYYYYLYNNNMVFGPFLGYNTKELCYKEYCTSNSQCQSNKCSNSLCDISRTVELIVGPIITVLIIMALIFIVCHRLKNKRLAHQLSHHQDTAVTYQPPQSIGTVLVS